MGKIDVLEAKIVLNTREIFSIGGQIKDYVGRLAGPKILITGLNSEMGEIKTSYSEFDNLNLSELMLGLYDLKRQVDNKYNPDRCNLKINIRSTEAIVD